MNILHIKKLFETHSCAVSGEKGSGKDVLFGNVIARRKLPYISNTDYGGLHIPFQYKDIDCGGNTYKDFIHGTLKKYTFPYPDKTDIYLADVGIYFPSQYCNELNRDYKQLAVFEAISRHTSNSRFHYNTQALNRCWDKIREQCERYITCLSCHIIGGLVIQRIRIYEKYDSAVAKALPWRIKLPLFASKEMKLSYKLQKQSYYNQHGNITERILVYLNTSKHDTRVFKTMLEGGSV